MLELDEVGPTLPSIARQAIESFVMSGVTIHQRQPQAPSAPVFVTLRLRDGSLRGCIGTLSAVEPDVVAETARSAVLAATRDPRFSPLRPEELPELDVEVSVLLDQEPVATLDELDPRHFGVVVSDQLGRRGLLLPEVPGVDDAAMQVDIARRKAGIPSSEPVRLHRFAVRKYRE
jgi:AmmeMemoRadiSam system protein A